MSKAIFTILNGRVFKISQSTEIPSILTTIPSQNKVTTNTDDHLKTVTETVTISNMDSSCVRTNAERYKAMCDYLKKMEVTELNTISNKYQVYLDYAICANGCELTHSVAIKPIDAKDAALLLGVATNNELVYRRVKLFENKISFGINNPLPLGIMDSQKKNYRFKINDITIYQDLSTLTAENLHNSIYENPACKSCDPCGNCGHSTVNDSLLGYAAVFSTSASGMSISDIDIDFVPRKIIVDLRITNGEYTVAYDDTEIFNIIKDNIEKKYAPEPTPPEGSSEEGYIPDSDKLPDADGSTTPNKEGYYNYYERCLSTTPDALLVVEDLISPRIFDKFKMIRKKKVLLDIPNILIGEYVHFVEVVKDIPTTDGAQEVDTDSDETASGVDEVETDDDIIMLDVGDIQV